MTTVDFYMSCVSVSRPCHLQGLAKTWPAFDKWAYKNQDDYSYLKKHLDSKKQKVTAFIDNEPLPDFNGFSFDDTYKQQIRYNDFLTQMSSNPNGAVMYQSSLTDALAQDIIRPPFYDNIGEFVRTELI